MPEWLTLTSLLRSSLGLVCVFLPGAAALVWLPMRRRPFVERAATAFGLGFSLIALAALLGRILALSYTGGMLVALEALCAVTVLLGLLRKMPRGRLRSAGFGALFVFIGILLLRLYQAHDLIFPPWVDSVHHALLVRIFVERGGLPGDLSPWLPIPFYYHFGFHASAAIFAAASGLTPDSVLLLFGQFLSAMAAVSVYRLSMAIRRDTRRALLAMALTGFVAQMPAFYLAWGRYTLLAGMTLLPLAMAEAIEFAHRAPRRAGLARLAILTAGVLLTHYLAGILLAVFFLIYGLSLLWKRKNWRRLIGLTLAALIGALLALPWLIPMLQHAAPDISVGLLTPSDSVDAVYFTDYAGYLWRLLGPLRNYILAGLALAALPVALFRKGPMRVFAVWGSLIALEALPWGLRLAPFRPDHMVIILFLPAAILLANGWISCADHLDRWKPAMRIGFWMGVVAVVGCLVGIWDTRSIVRPATVFADAADREAVLWAAEHTPPDSLFLINAALWQNGLYRGVDGGWWLLPLADRQTLLPPMVYSFGPRDYIDTINGWAAASSKLTGCSDDFWSFVRSRGITHIYVREDTGSLRLSSLLLCKGLDRIYLNQKVGIFRIAGSP
jgi:hypothetical protein